MINRLKINLTNCDFHDPPESKLNITSFGSSTANFKELPPPIPPE
jgi:hypothetical protein